MMKSWTGTVDLEFESLPILELSRPDWHAQGACAGTSPNLFCVYQGHTGALSPEMQARKDRALAVCEECPVRETCLLWAFDSGRQQTLNMVYGGRTYNERCTMVTQLNKADVPDEAWGGDMGLLRRHRAELEDEAA